MAHVYLDLNGQLALAIERGSLEETRELMTHGSLSRAEFYNFLELAVRHDRTEIVRLLIATGALVNRRYIAYSDSLLHIACRNKNEELVEILLSNGANTNVKNENSQTSLHIAVEKNLSNSAKLLLKHKADVNAADKGDITPLYIAVENDYYDIFRILLDFNANVNCVSVSNKGKTPLHLAATGKGSLFISRLLEKGAFVDMIVEGGFTPLHFAAEDSHFACEVLLKHGANFNAVTLKERMTPLHIACQCSNLKVVQLLIKRGAAINALAHDNKTPLHAACEKNNIDIVRFLLNNGADPTIKSLCKGTPLYIACDFENKEMIELILEKKVDVNAVSVASNTPLFNACYKGSFEIFRLLLRNGADVNVRSTNGMTPLHLAAENGMINFVEELLNYGANINEEVLESKYTALHCAVQYGCSNLVELLLSKGADIEALNADGNSPLHLSIKYEYEEVLKVLLEKGAKLYIENNDKSDLVRAVECDSFEIFELVFKYCRNFSPEKHKICLYSAIIWDNCNPEIVDKLLEHGVRIERHDVKHVELLHGAVRNNFIEILRDLLKLGADVNTVEDECGETLLHVAAMKVEIDIAELLIKYGADVNAVDKQRKTPIKNSVVKGNLKMTEYLLSKHAKVDTALLSIAVETKNLKMFQLLSQYTVHINGCDENGKTLLHFAVIGHSSHYSIERQDILKMILYRAANVNSQTYGKNILQDSLSNSYNELYTSIVLLNKILKRLPETPVKNGLTPLHIAVLEENVDVVKLLIQNGAQVDIETVYGITALYMATQVGNLRIMELLLEHEADVNTRDDLGRTPAHIASEKANLQAIQLLYKYGADLNIKCNGNQTAYVLALLGDEDFNGSNLTNEPSPYQQIFTYFRQITVLSTKCFKDTVRGLNKISLNEIFSMDVNLFARAAKKPKLLELIRLGRKGSCVRSDVLEHRVRTGVERNRLMDRSFKRFILLFSNVPQLPHDCVVKIFSHFTNEELRFFIKR